MSTTDEPPPPPSFITATEQRQEETARPKRPIHQEPSAINVERIDRNINESLRKQIIDIITKNPDFALRVLRGWKDRGNS
ncbi:MAG: hypothetical protein HOL66_09835 [Rhodospirillaceae bacterium]|nr:hypothetical protein [Rhodospirillaceae bacterium]MBT5244536.1 hypothetical protein [Rhodospirillaceae bacterium]MBT5562868.1 hypothetical protein [Rhodospirillaceae bacterium]MBT6242492.1 hypothetical protein [Rhodospirillaceae bacterium]MBT7137966.1 hypothetical protein [Rhodospirillaceae bacterium]